MAEKERRDIVITDTPAQPLAHTQMGGESREGGLEETGVAMNVDLFECGNVNGRKIELKAEKKRLVRLSFL